MGVNSSCLMSFVDIKCNIFHSSLKKQQTKKQTKDLKTRQKCICKGPQEFIKLCDMDFNMNILLTEPCDHK